MRVMLVDPREGTQTPKELVQCDGRYALEEAIGEADLYLGPPWIDSHCHVFHGVNFGILPDEIGYRTGVHLLVDAGSAGVETLEAFARYIVSPARTRVMAYLNVSAIGLVTMQEYYDVRHIRPEDTARAILARPDLLAGVKVRSSGFVVEERGLLPLRRALEAAELAGCPVMIHMGEAPPSNAENLALLRRGDILTHCFHGKQPPAWNAQPLWDAQGEPIPEMQEALDRGVLLDVGHGEASFSAAIAAPVIARGQHAFSISTDLHGRSWKKPVRSLAVTMSKFLALGMPLEAVIRAVTAIPAERLGIDDWCDMPAYNGTLFRLRPPLAQEEPFEDACGQAIDVRQVIEPVAVLMAGELIRLDGLKEEYAQ